ncbi:TPA: hypothetical protein RUZ94_003531 [Vibrio cholerae]|uniref:hypothetical protein n=1 Tax=Vibrio cholerae TaxID=666 RepID=UPI0028D9F4C1|nr:hypothetical protein [Vibrio cholerae]EKF9850524.1 hypothetical protein [Vibrio cholerae]MDV2307277.1 hypothetical protein [Vibrio cholerae]MEB5541868.1 hypothetical protein [Vibrio cholerae]MEB5550511.1 hypothetical protein [Vibrio cholerae]HDZ9500607.1 hypothetical protein [Vibrio cholerae]
MGSKVRLSAEQKKALSVLEPQLRLCLKSGDLNKAKKVTGEIVKLLRPTGHDTRILQAKNWLFEVAMEAGNLTYAKLGFEGIIKKSSGQTRLHLEATALLSICYIREQNLDMARELIIKAVRKINNIKSVERRKQFHSRLLERLEEESILVGLVNQGGKPLEIDQVDAEAVKLVMSKTEDQILIEMGKAVPKQSIEMLNHVRETYQLRIAHTDKKLLPPPLTEDTKVELGKRANTALKRVAWRALCSPESEIYKAWSNGLSVVYDKKYIAGAIVASFNSFSISATMIAASAAALAIKFGAEVFCETFAPKSMMIERVDKS